MTRTPLTAPQGQATRERLTVPYPRVRVIVLDDDVNTFEHVVRVLVRTIPGMEPDQAWSLAYQIDGEGSAVVWSGPLEQGELYHQQLAAAGLTMAPLEPA
ncbi:MAG: ATP-dependent Clp protease adapter ClpS [Cyanobacteriota bacterium]|jgi:ATP-dependent Clp protease adaptor protein ClpS